MILVELSLSARCYSKEDTFLIASLIRELLSPKTSMGLVKKTSVCLQNRMVGKDIRCFLDFESATKLSFLSFNPNHPLLNLRSFMAKSMTCTTKINDQVPIVPLITYTFFFFQNSSEMTLVCVPDDLLPLPPTVVPPVRKIPDCEVDRPILAALLRRKDPVPAPVTQIQKDEGALRTERGPMRVDTRNLTISTVPTVRSVLTRKDLEPAESC